VTVCRKKNDAARPITAARPRPPKPAKPAAPVEAAAAPASTGPTSPSGINPAAAGVRQNGAGLYGAGGAGAVGAGAAAAGQAGIERGTSTTAPASSDAAAGDAVRPDQAAHGQVGAHAVGHSSDDTSRETSHDTESPAPADRSSSASAQPEQTRVHDVVRDDTTRTYAAADSTGERARQEPITATRSADEEPVVEAFWFAVGSQRPVYDEQTGREVFRLQPGDWEVGIEDRGSEFLVQDKRTGAVGILRDLRNIERAPRD
jgi:hypothetical protein